VPNAVVTGNPLYSVAFDRRPRAGTGAYAGILERIGLGVDYSVRIDKLPVVLGGLIGVPIAVWLVPRRVVIPLVV